MSRGGDRIVGALLAEAREAALSAPAGERERLLSGVVVSMGLNLGFEQGLEAAETLTDPVWRARAYAGLFRDDLAAADAERALAGLRAAAEALVGGDAAFHAGRDHPAVADAHVREHVPGIVKALLSAGELELAVRLCGRFPEASGAVDLVLDALLEAGRHADALAAAMRAPEGSVRDGLLETVADGLAEHGRREEALAAAERISDPFARERQRLYVLRELAGVGPDRQGDVALAGIRDALSALVAMESCVRQSLYEDDAEGARAFGTAAARIAVGAVDPAHRARALELAAKLRAEAGDVDGALETARLLTPGEVRDALLIEALWTLVPEDVAKAVEARAVMAPVLNEDEREIAAMVIARSWIERRDPGRARRWLGRVRTPGRRAVAAAELAYLLLEKHGGARRAARALREVPLDLRDDMMMRNLAVEQLRSGDEAGAAATLAGMPSGAEWATWSLAGLAARYGQAERARGWARKHLGHALRVAALLGVVAYLDQPPPYEGPRAHVFR